MKQLDAGRLLDQAKQFMGTDDFGERIHEAALGMLASAYDRECTLKDFHLQRLEFQLQHLVTTRAKVAALLRAHPEIRDVEIRSPVFIVGMPRTGTTLLHNTLARHPDHFAPPLWQLQSPIREEATNEAWEQTAVARSQFVLSAMHQTIPELATIHPMNAYWPDECSLLFRPACATMVNAFTYRIPSYARWLLTTDMKPYYQAYRTLLQILLYQRGKNTRLILKDPCHLWHLGVLLDVFPDAKVLFLHRHLDSALPSFASLCYAFQRHWTEHQDPIELGTYCTDLLEEGLTSAVFIRRTMGKGRILDVAYRSIVENTTATIEKISAFIGARFDPEALAAMNQWQLENPQHKAGRHVYSLEQFGFRREAIMDRFRAYHETCLPD
jgi:hypothetical protein